MKHYTNPDLQFVECSAEDVIATSGIQINEGAAPDPASVVDSLDF